MANGRTDQEKRKYGELPKRFWRVWNALNGRLGTTEFVVRTGYWRNKDIILATGHPCDERKLRELRKIEGFRHLIREKEFQSNEFLGHTFVGFRLAEAREIADSIIEQKLPPIDPPKPVQPNLFDVPARGPML